MFIKTSAVNVIHALNKSNKWKLNVFALQKFNPTYNLKSTGRFDNKTASFKYIGSKR